MLTRIEAPLTQRHILTRHTLVHCTSLLNLFQLTSITIVVIADAYLLAVDTLFQLILFHFNNPDIFLSFYIPT